MKISVASSAAITKADHSRGRWRLIAAIALVLTGILLLAGACPEIEVARTDDTVRIGA